MRKPILALAILAVALTPAFAHAGGQAKSVIGFEGYENTGAGALLYGYVDSTKGKCTKDRTVELDDPPRKTVRFARSSIPTRPRAVERGAPSSGRATSPQNLFVRVKKSEAADTKCRGNLTIIIF